jgi:hypothetical protein
LKPAALSSTLPASEIKQSVTLACIRRVQNQPILARAKARDFRNRATEYLNGARVASDSNVQRRFVDIAQHYRLLAEAEVSSAERMGAERREQSGTSQLDGSAELQTLRLKLRYGGSPVSRLTKLFDHNARPLTRSLRKSSTETIRSFGKYWQILLNSLKRPCGAQRRRRLQRPEEPGLV